MLAPYDFADPRLDERCRRPVRDEIRGVNTEYRIPPRRSWTPWNPILGLITWHCGGRSYIPFAEELGERGGGIQAREEPRSARM